MCEKYHLIDSDAKSSFELKLLLDSLPIAIGMESWHHFKIGNISIYINFEVQQESKTIENQFNLILNKLFNIFENNKYYDIKGCLEVYF